jgi:hypothetical protein
MIKKIFTLLFSLLTTISGFSTVYYVATDGSDSNSGTITSPFATIQQAQTAVVAGDTVYIRGGTYYMTESQISTYYSSLWAYVTYLTKSGSAGKRINYWAYPGETPIFNLSNVKPSGYRITVFQVNASYIYIKGIQIVGTQVTITTHTQSECFENQGSYNIYENCKMHDGQAIGFYLTKGSYNLIKNCDAYRNYDYTSESGAGGNTDGFGCHPASGSVGNRFLCCRAWFNSDDGYDCISASEAVTFDSCWSFWNGYNRTFTSIGDGNGFKCGGYGTTEFAKLPTTVPSHTIRFCMAFNNKANGFYSNHNLNGSTWYNNTAYKNSVNYNMLNRDSLTSDLYLTDVAGYNHVIKNNISLSPRSTDYSNINTARCTIVANTFLNSSATFTLSSADFMSLDTSLLTAARQIDGSLPDNNLLRLKSTSDLIDQGVDLGFPYNSSAPDLGAFEVKSSQSITFDSIPSQKLTDASLALAATSSSGLSVSYFCANPSIAVIKNNAVYFKGIGTTYIIAYQTGNVAYSAATEVKRYLVVTKGEQTITFSSLSNKKLGDAPFKLNASSSAGLTISYSSSDETVATVSNDTVTVKGLGTTSITASQNGNDTFLAATNISQQLTIEDTATLVSDIEANIEKIYVFPNPAIGDQVNVKFKLIKSSEVTLSILNSSGRILYSDNLGSVNAGENVYSANISAIPSGVYFVKLQTKDGACILKFIH